MELDLTEAIEAGKVAAQDHIARVALESSPGWDGTDVVYVDTESIDAAVRAAAPIIERAVEKRLLGPPSPIAGLGAEVQISIRHRGHRWASSVLISEQEIQATFSPVDPVRWSLLKVVDEVLAVWRPGATDA